MGSASSHPARYDHGRGWQISFSVPSIRSPRRQGATRSGMRSIVTDRTGSPIPGTTTAWSTWSPFSTRRLMARAARKASGPIAFGSPDGTAALPTPLGHRAAAATVPLPGQFLKINSYTLQSGQGGNTACTAGQIMPIGTVAHETGHAFGLPDLYDTDAGSGTSGIGEWGLMGAGNYARPYSPSSFDAWSLASWAGRSSTPCRTIGRPPPDRFRRAIRSSSRQHRRRDSFSARESTTRRN